jgi:hypothetical protein
MEEMNLSQSAETSAPASAPVSEAPTQTERTLSQSQVNELIGRAKHDAVESFKRQQSQNTERQASNQSQSSGVSEDHYRKIAAEEAQRLRDQWVADAQGRSEQENAQRIVENFYSKTSAGKEKYEDFDAITGDIELARFPNVVQLLSEHIDNSHDVLYELGKDRLKMAQLEQLSMMSPKDAIVQARRMAESIKDNESASRVRSPNAPLSQQRPSYTGTDAGGVLTASQLKAKYRA